MKLRLLFPSLEVEIQRIDDLPSKPVPEEVATSSGALVRGEDVSPTAAAVC